MTNGAIFDFPGPRLTAIRRTIQTSNGTGNEYMSIC